MLRSPQFGWKSRVGRTVGRTVSPRTADALIATLTQYQPDDGASRVRQRRTGSRQGCRQLGSRVLVRIGTARRIAERVHRGSPEANGETVIAHVRRVAQAAPGFAQPVAWLHEVLECASVPEEELLAAGLTDEELRALRLLTRDNANRSRADYFAHIGRIAGSSGRAGDIARTVKQLDLSDRLEHPRRRADGWHPPYRLALQLLLESESTGTSDSRAISRRPVPAPLATGVAASNGVGSRRVRGAHRITRWG
jgi:hypothetical protein